MQEDKTCQEQETSVGVGGEGQSEGAGQVKGQYRAYPVLVYGTMFFFAQRRDFFCENHAAPHSTCFSHSTSRMGWGWRGVGQERSCCPAYVRAATSPMGRPWAGVGQKLSCYAASVRAAMSRMGRPWAGVGQKLLCYAVYVGAAITQYHTWGVAGVAAYVPAAMSRMGWGWRGAGQKHSCYAANFRDLWVVAEMNFRFWYLSWQVWHMRESYPRCTLGLSRKNASKPISVNASASSLKKTYEHRIK